MGNGAGGLDGDVFAGGPEGGCEFMDAFGNHGFATRQDNELGRVPGNFGENLIDIHFRPFRVPGGIGSIAPRAPEVATGSADKDRGDSCQFPLPLNAVEYFRDAHGQATEGFGGRGPLERYCVGSGIPARRNASRRSTQVPQVPQCVSSPL